MTPRRLLVAMGFVWGISGLVEPYLPNAGEVFNAVGIAQGLATAVLLFSWCRAHARAHSIEPPIGAALLVGLIAPVGVPYYALRGFGLRGGARLIALAIVTFTVFTATYFACFEISARLVVQQFGGVRP